MTIEFARPVDGALFMKSLGLNVFPLKPNGKTPEDKGWQKWAAKASEQKVKDFGTANPMHNWGVCCGSSNIVAVDIDNKNGTAGNATFKKILNDGAQKAPDTLSIETPTGGYHLYFEGEGRNTVGALGEGIDTRGVGGYVVAPGSRIDGKSYTIKRDAAILPLPKWLSTKLATSRKEPAPELPSEIIEGERNHALASLAGTMRSRGASHPVILAALIAMNEHQFATPVSDEEVEKVAASIAQYEPSIAKAAAEFTPISTQPATERMSMLASEITPATIPARDWIMKHRYIGGFISLIVSPGGVGKSAFTMLDAVAIATGEPLSGFVVPSPAPVWIYNTEDPMEELHRRMTALSITHDIPLDTMTNIRITSGRDAPLILAAGDRDNVVINDEAIEKAISHINEHHIRVLIADPFVRTHAVQENDNAQIDKVAWCFQRIVDATGCAVAIVHHTRKPNLASGPGGMHDARGASALVNAARIAHTLSEMTKEEAEACGLPEERRRWHIRLDNVKANLHPPAERADWYERVSVAMPHTGDDVGSLKHAPLATLAQARKKQQHEQQIVDIGIMLEQVMEVGERALAAVCRDLITLTDFGNIFKVGSGPRVQQLVMGLLKESPEHNGKVFTYQSKPEGQTRHLVRCSENMSILMR